VHGESLSVGLSGLVSDVLGRYMLEIVHSHVHVQTDQFNFCECTCAHMHKTDLPIAPNNIVLHGAISARPDGMKK
jgi:hypothetical protein